MELLAILSWLAMTGYLSETMSLEFSMPSKRVDAELNTREANVQEETRDLSRGFVSVFIELSRHYPRGECEENKILHTW